jgi:hypothetical protein
LILSFIGACLLWVGWFGFNAGSAVSAGGLATTAFVATHFAAASGALGWIAAEWARTNKPSVLGAITGAVAGLVAVTPASGFVSPASALLLGVIAGAVCYVMTAVVKRRFGYDDSLDVFGVHGAAGTIGAVLTGVFATTAINPIFKDGGGNALPVGARRNGSDTQPVNSGWFRVVDRGGGQLRYWLWIDSGLRVSRKKKPQVWIYTARWLAYAHQRGADFVWNWGRPRGPGGGWVIHRFCEAETKPPTRLWQTMTIDDEKTYGELMSFLSESTARTIGSGYIASRYRCWPGICETRAGCVNRKRRRAR